MRRGLLGGVAAVALLLASGTIASAADYTAPEAVDWSGPYIGVHAGYGEVYTNGIIDRGSFNLEQSDLDLSGVLVGAQVGYNFQMDSIVFGVEADLSYLDFKDEIWDTPSSGSSNTAADIDLLATVRGRLGVAMDDTLLYVTGGFALADAESSLLNSGESLDVSYNDVGGVVGGGVEYAATQSIRFRAEGLYYFFNDKESVSDAHSGEAGDTYELKDAFSVRLGVNFYFN
jgi:outer membrane immunogenic protein